MTVTLGSDCHLQHWASFPWLFYVADDSHLAGDCHLQTLMPRARKDSIQWLPGHYYHIYNRGARQLSIFREADNYLFVLFRVKKYCRQFDLTMIAYCLLPNHYHFLVRQNSDQAAGLLPRYVFNSYAKAYNKRYTHSGTLFEGRYKAKLVATDNYLRHLCRYIHANPVKDGLVPYLEAWPYSNYLEWLGLRPGTLWDRQFVLDYFGDTVRYQAFVTDFLIDRRLVQALKYLEGFGGLSDSHLGK